MVIINLFFNDELIFRLSCSEFYGGMEWLGINMVPDTVYRLVLYIDKTREGRIRYVDFEDAFTDPHADAGVEFNEQQTEPLNPFEDTTKPLMVKFYKFELIIIAYSC